MGQTDSSTTDGLSPEETTAIDALWTIAQNGDHYEILGITEDADRSDVQRAFYELSRKWHPDRYFRQELGIYQERIELLFVAITEAYRTLSNDAARFTYDMELEKKPAKARRRARLARAQAPTADTPDGTPAADPTPTRRARPSATRRSDARRKRAIEAAKSQMRDEIRGRRRRAAKLFQEGQAAIEAGNIIKAASALGMACTYDPKNAEYAKLAATAKKQARLIQSKQLIGVAETSESYGNWREALSSWQKAIEFGTLEPRAHYRAGVLTKRVEEDNRGALTALREAVRLAPDVAEYRLTLGELYQELGLGLNARRQAEAVLKVDKTNTKAKELLKDTK